MPERHLRVSDAETGEVFEDGCPQCAAYEDQVKGLERDLRTWRLRYADLMRDKEAEAKKDPLWADAARLFKEWKRLCRPKSKAQLTYDRFALIQPFLKRHGFDLCLLAIEGAAFDPFITTRKNGRPNPHNGIPLIFKDADKFESFVQRAPKEAVARYKAATVKPEPKSDPASVEQTALLRPVDRPQRQGET
jgi:hypothetical protein